MSGADPGITPDQLRRMADVAHRLYELSTGRFNYLVDRILTDAANGNTSVRKIVDVTARTAQNSDYWDPVLQELHDRAMRNYPRVR